MTDSCPNCCKRGIAPAAEKRRGDAIVCRQANADAESNRLAAWAATVADTEAA